MNPVYGTREEWLHRAKHILTERFFLPAEKDLPEVVRVSTGWSKGAKKGSVGWCWKPTASDDNSTAIFISPEIVNPEVILAVLLHEMIHAHDRNESKHAGNFRKVWAQFGFIGKPTGSTPGLDLGLQLAEVAAKLGPYPHAKMNVYAEVKTQTTRMLKAQCVDAGCGCIIRMTQKWVDEVGAPTCGCGSEMEIEVKE